MSRLSTKQRRAARRRREGRFAYAGNLACWNKEFQTALLDAATAHTDGYEKWPGATAFFDRIEERYSAMLRAAVKASTAMYGD